MNKMVVIMGVAGCGKSSLGRACADVWHVPLLEGDDYHSAHCLHKMASGTPLDDTDRAAWLDRLVAEMNMMRQTGAVLTCSALKHRYRERLRAAVPGLKFLFLFLTAEQAKQRVAARPAHIFPVSLVDSQFEALEDPSGEAGVLSLDATRPIDALAAEADAWMLTQTFLKAGVQ